jgi:hypothetical protein
MRVGPDPAFVLRTEPLFGVSAPPGFNRGQGVKVLIFISATFGIGVLSMAIAKGSESIPISWCVGYFTAVLIVMFARGFWKKQ